MINLTLKKINPNSVYPILLQNKKYLSPVLKKSYNYAVYDDNQLMYSAGEFNYDDQVLKKMEEVFVEDNKEFYYRNFHHYAFEAPNGKKVIVSSPDTRIAVFSTNFSFFFLVFILSIFLLMLLATLVPAFRQVHKLFNQNSYLFEFSLFVSINCSEYYYLSIINSTYKLELEDNFSK